MYVIIIVAGTSVSRCEQLALWTELVVPIACSVTVPIFPAVKRIRVGSCAKYITLGFFVTAWCCSGGGGGCLIHATLIAGSTDWSVSAISLVSVIAAIVAKIKKHVSPTGIVLSYSSIAMPKLPAIIGVRMPAVSMFHTIQRMATVVVRIGGGGGRGKRKRKK